MRSALFALVSVNVVKAGSLSHKPASFSYLPTRYLIDAQNASHLVCALLRADLCRFHFVIRLGPLFSCFSTPQVPCSKTQSATCFRRHTQVASIHSSIHSSIHPQVAFIPEPALWDAKGLRMALEDPRHSKEPAATLEAALTLHVPQPLLPALPVATPPPGRKSPLMGSSRPK